MADKMTKREFLDMLRLALSGRVAPDRIEEHVRFYEDYINTEVRKGRSEDEVLAALGDPRLIARTIVEADNSQRGQSADYAGGPGENSQYDNGSHKYEEKGQLQQNSLLRVPAWVWIVVAILVVVLVLSAVFSVIAAILPVLLPILLVLLAVKVFRNWVN